MEKKIIPVLISCIILLGLTACYKIEPEEKAKLNELAKAESSNFKKQAEVQYGKDAIVTGIQGERIHKNDPLFPIVTASAGENLTGKISNKEYGKFNAIYLINKNEIISDKNSRKINESTKELLESAGANVIIVEVTDSARRVHIVRDDIDTFEKVLDDEKVVFINGVTDSEIDNLKLDEIYEIMEKYSGKSALFIEIVQVNKFNKDKISSLINALAYSGISVESEMHKNKEKRENRVNELNIESYLRVSYDKHEKEGIMNFMNIKGEQIYRTTNGKEIFYNY